MTPPPLLSNSNIYGYSKLFKKLLSVFHVSFCDFRLCCRFFTNYGRNKKLLRNFFDLKIANCKKLLRFTSGLRFFYKKRVYTPRFLLAYKPIGSPS